MPGNKQWVVLREPESKYPIEGKDIELREGDIPEPGENEFLVQILALTVDPYLRNTMTPVNFYSGKRREFPFVMEGGAVGRIVKSNNAQFPEGTIVNGTFGWQEYAVASGAEEEGIKVVPNTHRLSHALGVLGMPGATAYLGLTKICDPKEGETLVVSGAAGAVGSYVGQIGKLLGARVIGFAGGEAKCNFLTQELGFDHAINYEGKPEDELAAELKALAPEGVECYFDNTGSQISLAVFRNLKTHGRVSVCGQIANYGSKDSTKVSLTSILANQWRVEGFIIVKWASEWPQAHAQLQEWIASGKLKVQEDITVGIDNVFEAFLELFKQGKDGKSNIGKKIVLLAPEDPDVLRETVSAPPAERNVDAAVSVPGFPGFAPQGLPLFDQQQQFFGASPFTVGGFGLPTSYVAGTSSPFVGGLIGPAASTVASSVAYPTLSSSYVSSYGGTPTLNGASYTLPAAAGTPIYQQAPVLSATPTYAAAPAVFSPTGTTYGATSFGGFNASYTSTPAIGGARYY